MSFWKKSGAVLATGLVAGFAAGGTISLFDKAPQVSVSGQDLSTLATQEDLADLGLQLTELQTGVDSLQDNILEEDKWEATAEVLALEELEDDDYEELREWIADEYNLTEDPEDIEDFSVDVRDTNFSDNMDADDEKGTVTFDLKVRFEDNDGDRVKKYITATVRIDDGDVDSLGFDVTTE